MQLFLFKLNPIYSETTAHHQLCIYIYIYIPPASLSTGYNEVDYVLQTSVNLMKENSFPLKIWCKWLVMATSKCNPLWWEATVDIMLLNTVSLSLIALVFFTPIHYPAHRRWEGSWWSLQNDQKVDGHHLHQNNFPLYNKHTHQTINTIWLRNVTTFLFILSIVYSSFNFSFMVLAEWHKYAKQL